jgi:hypothetical protein
MPEELEPTRPIDAYKAIIDQLVSKTSHGVSERLIAEQGIFSKAPAEQSFNAFVQSLSPEQRRMLARMLHTERIGAIHDVLAVLSWWVAVRKVGFSFRGESMPVELSGMGLHGDYIGRLDGWEWPKDGDNGANRVCWDYFRSGLPVTRAEP